MENKTGKYFKYAIGEIVLVVIGILIALSLNNWNEQRKQHQSEIKTLKELLGDAKADAVFFTSRLGFLSEYTNTISILNELILNKKNESLANLPYNNSNVFETSLAYQSTVISNFKNRIESVSDGKIKSILRKYSLAYHYLETHYIKKDEAYDKYLDDLMLKYDKTIKQFNEQTTYGEVFNSIDFRKNEHLVNFVSSWLFVSKSSTENLLKINAELQIELETYLSEQND